MTLVDSRAALQPTASCTASRAAALHASTATRDARFQRRHRGRNAERIRRLGLALVVAIAIGGCTAVPVVLRHPDGRVTKCDPIPLTSLDDTGCIKYYERQGFQRAPE